MLRAVLTGMDTHPANSLAMVLRSIGYEVFMLSDRAMRELSNKGYTGGVYRDTLDSMGYHDTTIEWTDDPQGDMFIDLKLHDLESMLKIYPDLKGVLYVINGGWDDYEHYGEHYPTLTNNFWIKGAFHYYSPLDNVNNLAPQLSRRIHPPIGLLHNAYNWGFKALVDPIREKTGLRIFGSYGSPDGQIHNKQV